MATVSMVMPGFQVTRPSRMMKAVRPFFYTSASSAAGNNPGCGNDPHSVVFDRVSEHGDCRCESVE
jgi:hypothetical protein